jgi:hypothetical protein
MEIARRTHIFLVLSDESLLVMGGVGSVSGQYFNDVWKSVDGGFSWILVTENAAWKGKGTTHVFQRESHWGC